MTRSQFRDAVLARDGVCVICGDVGPLDAHHIMERRLWDDEGYHMDNGAALCDDKGTRVGCHRLAERTLISCDEIRRAAGIGRILLPEHLYDDLQYDKWGNICLPNGTRVKGELFHDPSVRKVLAEGNVLKLFGDLIKYPRTYHLPWSPGMTRDDRMLRSLDHFEGLRVVVTEKLDGENTTLYSTAMHARSLDSGGHPSRDWVKNLHGRVASQIPALWRVCGENLYARHTLKYDDLPSYFMVFSIWDEFNRAVSWDDTVSYARVLDLETVPVLYDGIWDEAAIRKIASEMDLTTREGYVVRLARGFSYGEFRRAVAKFVRAEHVGSSHNWMMKSVEKNGLRKEKNG